ncbi:MAG: hypothetical protein Kow0074_11480 [Candidatus Zixiibacteriota bacterium]
MLVKLEANEAEGLREKFRVAGLPTVILAKPNGEEIDRTYGFIRTATFIDTIEGYHNGIGTLDAMMSKESEMSSDLKFIYALGNKFYERRRWEDADARFAAVVKQDSSNSEHMAAKAQLKRAIVAGRQEKYLLANAFCNALIEKWPASEQAPDAMVYLGYYSYQDGRNDDALAAYKQYLDKWPEGEDAEWVSSQIKKLESPENTEE